MNNRNNGGNSENRWRNNSYNEKEQEKPRELPAFDIKEITKELFDTKADKCAKTISEINGKDCNKGTQLRRFYDELVQWYERGITDDDAFENVLPFVYMIKSKVAYACGRKTVDATFQDFMYKLINQINDRKTLKNAKLFMEAVMGFYKQYNKD